MLWRYRPSVGTAPIRDRHVHQLLHIRYPHYALCIFFRRYSRRGLRIMPHRHFLKIFTTGRDSFARGWLRLWQWPRCRRLRSGLRRRGNQVLRHHQSRAIQFSRSCRSGITLSPACCQQDHSKQCQARCGSKGVPPDRPSIAITDGRGRNPRGRFRRGFAEQSSLPGVIFFLLLPHDVGRGRR